MSLSFSQSQGNGVKVSYPITLEGGYLEADIVVDFVGVTTGIVVEQNPSTYTISAGNVVFSVAPPNTEYVRIRRKVTNASTYSDFSRGNNFGEDELNFSFNRALYQVQQLVDGFHEDDHYWKADINAGDRKLRNLSDGVQPEDAATKGQLDTLIGSNEANKDAAAASAASASQSADEAWASKTAAANSAQEAADSVSQITDELDQAIAAKDGAVAAQGAAELAQQNAENAQGAAESARDTAVTKAGEASASESSASGSASTATTKATEASNSAASALQSESNAATSAANANTSASNAQTSAQQSAASAAEAAGYAASINPEILSRGVNVKAFGAKGDGVTNDTAAIEAAFDWVGDNGGGIVYVPKGVYLVGGPMLLNKSNVIIIGEGIDTTTFRITTTINDTFVFGLSSNNLSNVGMMNLTIDAAAQQTGGHAITFKNGRNMFLDRIKIGANMYRGIMLLGGTNGLGQDGYHIRNFIFESSNFYGITIGSTDVVKNVFISNGFMKCPGANAIDIKHVSRLLISDVIIKGCFSGVYAVPAAGRVVDMVQATNMIIEDASDTGWYLSTSNGGTMGGHIYRGCWIAASSKFGWLVQGLAGSIFDSCRAVLNGRTGIWFNQPSRDITLSNCQCLSNSQITNDADHGLVIYDTCRNFTVTGGTFGKGGIFDSVTNNQKYGIFLGLNCNYITITGNNCEDNNTNGIQDGSLYSTATEIYISDNGGHYPIIPEMTVSDPMVIPGRGDFIKLTGGGSFGTMHGYKAGRRVTLLFDSNTTLSDGGSSLIMSGGFSANANDTISFISDGAAWYETSRSAN